jgi:pimeloyl-ACP methyl ester carboxylesterase
LTLATELVSNGYIVVAPNYAGYDSSNLGYHPFLVGDQQSKDMIDALRAARSALPTLLTSASDNGKLFVTGYSQGGYVALATAKAMEAAQAAGATDLAVTASAPLSPVSELSNYVGYILNGHVPVESTVLMPMALTGYQKTYGDVYTSPSQYYTAAYASGIESAFPGSYTSTALIADGIVPQLALFSGGAATDGTQAQNYLWSQGVGAGNLITDSARAGYPSSTFQTHIAANDLNNYMPTTSHAPMLYCGGANDPTVYFSVNAEYSANQATANPLVKILDVENSYPTYTGSGKLTGASITALQYGFQQAKAAAGSATAQAAVYHWQLVPPFCIAAAVGFFANFH